MTVRRFGPFHFNGSTGELARAGVPIRLEPQPARLLAALLARPGELVTREELCAAVWGESTFVDFEHGLNYAIRQVRTALGDSADSAQYIETLRGRGYRFIGPVESESRGSGSDLQTRGGFVWRSLALLAVTALIVATVLVWFRTTTDPPDLEVAGVGVGVPPFAAVGVDQRHWGEGLRAEVVARLSQWDVRPVVLLARTDDPTPTRWRLETSVRADQGRVRTTFTVVDALDRSVRWADTFEAQADAAGNGSAEVAARIALAVRLIVLGPDAAPPPERFPRRPRT